MELLTAFLTSIYSWRLIFKTFHGEYNNKDIKIEETHESPLVMLIPLILLSIGAIFAGYIFKELFIGQSAENNFWQKFYIFSRAFKYGPPATLVFIINSYFSFIINTSCILFICKE